MKNKPKMSEGMKKTIIDEAKKFIETQPGDISYPGKKQPNKQNEKKDN